MTCDMLAVFNLLSSVKFIILWEIESKAYLLWLWRFLQFNFLAGETAKAPEKDGTASKEKSGPQPVIVPIVLKMAEFDHKVWSFLSHLDSQIPSVSA